MAETTELAGQVAFVTGASEGIGEAVAVRLAEAGLRVALGARRVDRLEALAARLRAEGAEALPLHLDLRDEGSILAAFAAIRARWGGVDVMVNNGGMGRAAPLTSGATEDWRAMLETNVLGLCVCTREAVTDMRRRGDRGHVVHVSSMAAHRVPDGSGVYSATKYAVRALTEALRKELREQGSGVRVTSVSPGFVETGFAALYHRDPAAAAEAYGRYKVLEPDDVARAVLYVVSQPPWVQVHDLLMRPTDQLS